jgi:hypothetical protein
MTIFETNTDGAVAEALSHSPVAQEPGRRVIGAENDAIQCSYATAVERCAAPLPDSSA